ncbi:hypothetical protein GCM10010252_31180 [Streptomyces aureoverticillatus]|nr:hypothetical protein GCM10010252_31180 [Streptomyces aureoverticillatus]
MDPLRPPLMREINGSVPRLPPAGAVEGRQLAQPAVAFPARTPARTDPDSLPEGCHRHAGIAHKKALTRRDSSTFIATETRFPRVQAVSGSEAGGIGPSACLSGILDASATK